MRIFTELLEIFCRNEDVWRGRCGPSAVSSKLGEKGERVGRTNRRRCRARLTEPSKTCNISNFRTECYFLLRALCLFLFFAALLFACFFFLSCPPLWLRFGSVPAEHRFCINLLKAYGVLSAVLLVSDLFSIGAILGQVTREGNRGQQR